MRGGPKIPIDKSLPWMFRATGTLVRAMSTVKWTGNTELDDQLVDVFKLANLNWRDITQSVSVSVGKEWLSTLRGCLKVLHSHDVPVYIVLYATLLIRLCTLIPAVILTLTHRRKSFASIVVLPSVNSKSLKLSHHGLPCVATNSNVAITLWRPLHGISIRKPAFHLDLIAGVGRKASVQLQVFPHRQLCHRLQQAQQEDWIVLDN